jgi:hypothetical protein
VNSDCNDGRFNNDAPEIRILPENKASPLAERDHIGSFQLLQHLGFDNRFYEADLIGLIVPGVGLSLRHVWPR